MQSISLSVSALGHGRPFFSQWFQVLSSKTALPCSCCQENRRHRDAGCRELKIHNGQRAAASQNKRPVLSVGPPSSPPLIDLALTHRKFETGCLQLTIHFSRLLPLWQLCLLTTCAWPTRCDIRSSGISANLSWPLLGQHGNHFTVFQPVTSMPMMNSQSPSPSVDMQVGFV